MLRLLGLEVDRLKPTLWKHPQPREDTLIYHQLLVGLRGCPLWPDPSEHQLVFFVVDHVDEVVVLCLWHNVDIGDTKGWCLGGGILYRLQASHQLVGDAVVERITWVQATGDKRLDHRFGGIHRRATDGLTQLSQLIVRHSKCHSVVDLCKDQIMQELRIGNFSTGNPRQY